VITGFDSWSPDAVQRTRALSAPGHVLVGVAAGSALVRDPDGTWRGVGAVVPEVFVGGEAASLGDLPAAPFAT